MTVKTEKWRLTYCRPFFGNMGTRQFPTDSRSIHSGEDEYLLTTGKVINRPPKNENGEHLMSIPLTGVNKKYSTYTQQEERHLCLDLEVLEGKSTSTDPSQKRIEELAKLKLEWIKRSLYVSWIDFEGKQLNTNFPVDSQEFYVLENLTAIENQKADHDRKIKRLGYELSNMVDNSEEFSQVCYLFGLNKSILSDNEAYNMLSNKLNENPDEFDKKMSDPDRWYRIVLNKALRTLLPNKDVNYISEETTGEFTNYFQNGQLVATGFDALIGYYKDNKEIFDALEYDLELKKNGKAEEVKIPKKAKV